MVLLSLNFGIVFFDRNAMSYLGPFVQKDLGLSNAQIGAIASAFSIAWGLSGFAGGTMVDRFGHRKLFLVLATLVFSVCSVISGLAGSFVVLIAARMFMGVAEGPMNPVQQSFAAAESSPNGAG
ncbi:MAG: MFS transporter [Caulobacteraceae bacterium]